MGKGEIKTGVTDNGDEGQYTIYIVRDMTRINETIAWLEARIISIATEISAAIALRNSEESNRQSESNTLDELIEVYNDLISNIQPCLQCSEDRCVRCIQATCNECESGYWRLGIGPCSYLTKEDCEEDEPAETWKFGETGTCLYASKAECEGSNLNWKYGEDGDCIYATKADCESDNSIENTINAITEQTKALAEAYKKWNKANSRYLELLLEQAGLNKSLSTFESLEEKEEIQVWCADYTENLEDAAEVGTIEIPGEIGSILLRPGYGGASDYDAERDGILQQTHGSSAATFVYNTAMLPGWQKWMPQYRAGTITAIDRDENTCSITLVVETSSAQKLNVNHLTTLTDVPIEYMHCDNGAFQVDDIVVIEFENVISTDTEDNWNFPKVIGFVDHPVECPVHYGLVCQPVVGTSVQNPVVLVWFETEQVWKRYFLANYTAAYGGTPSYSTYDWRSKKQKEQTSIERRETWWPSRYYGIDLGAANVYRDGEAWFTGGSFTHPFSGSPYTMAAWTITEDEETKWACLLVKTAHYSGTPNDFRYYKRVFSESYPNELEYDEDTNPLGWQLVEQIDTPAMSPQYTSRKMADPKSFCAINASGTRGQLIAHDTPSKSDGTPHNPYDLTYPLGRYAFTFSPDAMTVEFVENDGVDLIYRSSYFESTNTVKTGTSSTGGTYPGPYTTEQDEQIAITVTERWTIGSVHGGGNPYSEIINAKIVTAVDYEEDTPLYLVGKVIYPSESASFDRVEKFESSCVSNSVYMITCQGIPSILDYSEGSGSNAMTFTHSEAGKIDPDELMTELFLEIHEGNKQNWTIATQRGSSMLFYAVPKANDAAPAYGYSDVGIFGFTDVKGLTIKSYPSYCPEYPGTYNRFETQSYTPSGSYAYWTKYVKGNMVLSDIRAGLLCIAARTTESKQNYTALTGDTFQRTDMEYDDKRKWLVHKDNGSDSETIHAPTPIDSETPNGTAARSAPASPCSGSSSYSESTTPGDPTIGFLGIRDQLHGAAMFALDNRKYGTPKYWHYMDASVNCDPYGNVLASLRHYDEDDTEIEWSILFNTNTDAEVTDLLDMMQGSGSLPDYLSLIGAIGFIDFEGYNETAPGGEW